MVVMNCSLKSHEKEALLIMFGPIWRRKFWALDGQGGRPSISDGIDFALRKLNAKAREDLVDYVEEYLRAMSKRCEQSAQTSAHLPIEKK